MRFCSHCGHSVEIRTPEGDHLPRHVCPACGTVHYHNPKVIVGIIPEYRDGRILMCRRNIEPRWGKWTFPAGFMELEETAAAGAIREGLEESYAVITDPHLLTVASVPYVNQVYLLYRGTLKDAVFATTPESSEVCLMNEADIPWQDIAFPTIYHALKCFFADRARGQWAVHSLELNARQTDFTEVTSWLPPL
jgi:8-oxo-dGTP pyrophosphatase MutT (NUDIX family)